MEWCWSSSMALNSRESVFVHFRTLYCMGDLQETIILTYGTILYHKLLWGNFLVCFLSFKPHITHIRSLIPHQSSILHLGQLIFLLGCYSFSLLCFIFPYLSYCCSVWCSTNISLLCSLVSVVLRMFNESSTSLLLGTVFFLLRLFCFCLC